MVVDGIVTGENLAGLIDLLESGVEKEIFMTRNDPPVAKVVSISSPPLGKRMGAAKGKFVVPNAIGADTELIGRMLAGESE
jgi:antitoxin (DNA-binding transcriptional repressor) of toxin-antitoxin stability system